MEDAQVEEEVVEDNPLDMSDEDFANAPPPEEEETAEEEEVSKEDTPETEEPEPEEEPIANEEVQEQEEESSEEVTEEAVEEPVAVDYEAQYKELMSPFRANGKEMEVSSVEDVRQLMSMGANYNKKMAALKPSMKLLKMLENNGLMDEEKLNYLIDLDKKNPEAIAKLMKEGNVDPLDIDTDKETSYKPNTYSVSDKEMELDSVLEEIKETETFNTTIDVIGNKWDEASKQVVIDNPNLIRVINGHVQDGIYAKIQSVIEQERMLGKLSGLNDIEAYKQVGDAINAQGGFNQQPQPSGISNDTNGKASNKVDPKLKARKKAASSTKSRSPTKKTTDFNPLSMSDEEFAKIAESKFY